MTETTETPINRFVELAGVNVGPHVEKKGSLSYLSWAWAVDQLLRRDPDASWEYGQPTTYGDTMMVFCTVTAFGKARTMQLPVMDHRNKAIPNPDAFQVNTAMQRCLVKAIALHGLGLYIYAGEDLPPGEMLPQEHEPAPSGSARAVAVEQFEAMPDDEKAFLRDKAIEIIALAESDQGDVVAYLDGLRLDNDEKLALWSLLPSKVRSYIKRAQEADKASKPKKPTQADYAMQA